MTVSQGETLPFLPKKYLSVPAKIIMLKHTPPTGNKKKIYKT
jgi:hypothetical protein